MLERLTIKNIALIRSQAIEFGNGLNVLTGETGAGKSLIIDSLSLLLGEKADKSLITTGENVAVVEAVFKNLSTNVKSILKDFDIEDEDILIISRKISNDGKNECRVNGTTFSLNMLKKLAAPLMDLHGQFEHQNLMKVQNHILVLDKFGGKDLLNFVDKYKELNRKLINIEDELNSLTADDFERQKLIDLYRFQMDEISDAGFVDGEEETLKDFRNQVLHQEKIVDTLNSVNTLLIGDGYEVSGVKEVIKKAENMLSNVAAYSKDLEDYVSRLNSARIELEDIGDSLADKLDNMYIDEAKAKQNEERLDLLSSMKKKYGNDIRAINEYYEKISVIYDGLINSEDRIKQLKIEKQNVSDQIIKIANQLSQMRKNAAISFESAVKNEIKELGMKSADFVVNFENLSLDNRNDNGFDKVEFMFSANLGEPVKPLKNVASGGEMSRLMLGIKNITAKLDGIGTLIFDEIDTGVSGHNALTLAQKLSFVSRYSQVICVTHLAQVASFGDNNFLIQKFEGEGKTTTSVDLLNKTGCINEVARLVSGKITENSLRSAEEMIEAANIFKKNIN